VRRKNVSDVSVSFLRLAHASTSTRVHLFGFQQPQYTFRSHVQPSGNDNDGDDDGDDDTSNAAGNEYVRECDLSSPFIGEKERIVKDDAPVTSPG